LFLGLIYRHKYTYWDQCIGSWLPPFLSFYLQKSTICFKQKPPKGINLLAAIKHIGWQAYQVIGPCFLLILEERDICLHRVTLSSWDVENVLIHSMELMKNSQTFVENMFLNETIKERALFHNETTPSKICNLFMTDYFSDIRPDQTRIASASATASYG
jgi:hypothetical protein